MATMQLPIRSLLSLADVDDFLCVWRQPREMFPIPVDKGEPRNIAFQMRASLVRSEMERVLKQTMEEKEMVITAKLLVTALGRELDVVDDPDKSVYLVPPEIVCENEGCPVKGAPLTMQPIGASKHRLASERDKPYFFVFGPVHYDPQPGFEFKKVCEKGCKTEYRYHEIRQRVASPHTVHALSSPLTAS